MVPVLQVLALALRRNNVDVRIIDKKRGAITGLPCIFIASLARVARDPGGVRRRQPRIRANPNKERVQSAGRTQRRESMHGPHERNDHWYPPRMCTHTVSSHAYIKLITYNPPAQPDVVMLEQNHHERILKVRLEA